MEYDHDDDIGSVAVNAFDEMGIKFAGTNIDTVLKVVRILNCGMASALCILYPVGFITGGIDITVQKIILCLYSVIFSGILIVYELRVKNGRLNWMFKNMCGFMYSFCGRLLFLLFISSLALAGRTKWCYIVGSLGCILSFANCCVVYNHPSFSDQTDAIPDEREEEVREYIQREALERACEKSNTAPQTNMADAFNSPLDENSSILVGQSSANKLLPSSFHDIPDDNPFET